jgi:hypothetical protein
VVASPEEVLSLGLTRHGCVMTSVAATEVEVELPP